MDSAGRTPSVDESWRAAIAVQQNDLSTERGASFQLGRAADGSPVLTRDSGHGKEGVDGSSPSEGSFEKTKSLQIATSLLPRLTP
jgi:hypothetical protein